MQEPQVLVTIPHIQRGFIKPLVIGLFLIGSWSCFVRYAMEYENNVTRLDRWLFSIELDTCFLRVEQEIEPISFVLRKAEILFVNFNILTIVRSVAYWTIVVPSQDQNWPNYLSAKPESLGIRYLWLKYEEDFPCVNGHRIMNN